MLLVAYFGVVDRSPLIGLVTMIPSMFVVVWVLGTMYLLGISFNVFTAMVSSLAIGIGVLTLSSLEPMQQFGLITALVIIYSLIASVVVQPVCLAMWAKWRDRRRGSAAEGPDVTGTDPSSDDETAIDLTEVREPVGAGAGVD